MPDELPYTWADDAPASADRVARLERELEDARARLTRAEYDLGPAVYDPDTGIDVCAAASSTGPGGICGLPVESEPCRTHSLGGRLAALEELTRDQADLLEKHSRDLEPAARERPGRFTEATDT
ncbi:hypothetical protein [Nocardiopsis synnemataformans]|uniref:hypothetical protein n=1 Tax=Nocardiopsis synnemataformans TaxID=61305 RepID=UPI003EC02099